MFNSSSKFQRFTDKRKGKIWQLFRATDFESLMYPCFTLCYILGAFPYKINASTIKICTPSYVLSTIIICVFCVFNLIILYDINISKNNLLEGTAHILQINCFFIFDGVIAVATFISSGPRMRLLQTIRNLSSRLPQESYQNLSRLIHVKDLCGFFFIAVQLSIYYYSIRFSVLRKILALYILLLSFELDMLYMNCVCILKACFEQINDSLANLRQFVARDKLYSVRETRNLQRNPYLLMAFKAIKKQHLAISDTVQMLKMVFSLQLLSSIIITFIQITFNLYFYLIQIQETVSASNLEREIYHESFITIVTYYIIKLVLIVWACETGKNQAMKVNTIIHDVFNSTSDKEIKYELHLFSLQLMHRKNVFSAKGLIVDATLLVSMADNSTKYLLILIQFLLISHSCDERFIEFYK